MENTHIFYQAAISPLTTVRVKRRMSLSIWMDCLRHDIDGISLEYWTQHAWRGRWENSNYQLNNFIACPSSKHFDYDLKQSQWILINCLRSGHG